MNTELIVIPKEDLESVLRYTAIAKVNKDDIDMYVFVIDKRELALDIVQKAQQWVTDDVAMEAGVITMNQEEFDCWRFLLCLVKE